MESYINLAGYYDVLMDDVDYEQWTQYILSIFKRFNIEPKSILDTACGTGNITIPFARLGYDIWGVDISEEMLSIAESKARNERLKVKFLNQDISMLNINKSFDAVNYLLEEEQLCMFLNSTKNIMEDNGLLIFDISSYYKLSSILGNNSLFQSKNNIYYIWDNIFNEDNDTVEMNIVFFVPEDKLYRKFDEVHIQKAYKVNDLKRIASACGFSMLGIYDGFSFNDVNENSERIFFVAKKTI